MGSKQKLTKQRQIEYLEHVFAQRKTLLAEKGVDASRISKDSVIKHLQAEIARTVKAVAAITARDKIIEKARQQKQERIAQKKAAAAQGKTKKAKTPPPEEKKKEQKKKKSKKSDAQ